MLAQRSANVGLILPLRLCSYVCLFLAIQKCYLQVLLLQPRYVCWSIAYLWAMLYLLLRVNWIYLVPPMNPKIPTSIL